MKIYLLKDGYKTNEGIYRAFLDNELAKDGYISDSFYEVNNSLKDLNLNIYLGKITGEEKTEDFAQLVKNIYENIIDMDREIYMDERFWHSYLLQCQREYILDKYPKVKEDYKDFKNIVIKKFDWENYIYKATLLAVFIRENSAGTIEDVEKYAAYAIENMDVFNYMLKYESLRTGKFVLNILEIIHEENLVKVSAAKIDYMTKDERYGRRVLFEMNKNYPILMFPTMEKEDLKRYYIKYLNIYLQDERNEDKKGFGWIIKKFMNILGR